MPHPTDPASAVTDPRRCSPDAARAFVANAAADAARGFDGLVSTPARVLTALHELLAQGDALAAKVQTYGEALRREREAEAVQRRTSAAEDAAERHSERTLGSIPEWNAATEANRGAEAALATARAATRVALDALIGAEPARGPAGDAP